MQQTINNRVTEIFDKKGALKIENINNTHNTNTKNLLFDSHAHVDDKRYDADRADVIASLRRAGIDCIINVGSNLPHSRNSVQLAAEHDFIYASVGIHPHYANDITDADIEQVERLAQNKKVVAIGEAGLDYHYDNTVRENQQYWFKRQLELADRLALPIIIHCRDANGDMMDMLRQFKPKRAEPGVLHCFSGNAVMAHQAVSLGYCISFAGPLTYKNARAAVEAAECTPLDKILIETDSPYLAPHGHRGERNSPAYVRIVCEKLAAIKGMSFDQVAAITNQNARRLFGI